MSRDLNLVVAHRIQEEVQRNRSAPKEPTEVEVRLHQLLSCGCPLTLTVVVHPNGDVYDKVCGKKLTSVSFNWYSAADLRKRSISPEEVDAEAQGRLGHF